jgi:cytochrome P450
MRKLLSNGFTPRALRQQEPILQKYVGLLIERLNEMAIPGGTEGAVLNIVPWFNFTTFDIFGDLGFAESFDCLQHARYHPWIALLFNSVKAASFVIAARFYPLIEFLLMSCIPKSLKKTQSDHYQQIVDKVQRRMNWEVDRPDLMSYVIKHNDGKEGMSLGEIQATFMVLTTAGSETTATVLSGTLNNLIAKPDKLLRLTQEVRGRFSQETGITLDTLGELPYLNAAIQEGLRLCPPIPVMLPRVVPQGGDTVCGTWMPSGVSVFLDALWKGS